MLEQITLLIISLFSNTLSAIAGGGAGLVQLPALILLGLPFSVALATHKIASVALGVGATIRHTKQSVISPYLALSILGAGLPGVIIGARTILAIDEYIAELILGVLTVALGVYSLSKKHLGLTISPKKKSNKQTVTGILGLFFIGFLNGAFSSGTGLFVTLWLITWYGCDYKKATAHTMIFVGLFWNGSGALAFAFLAEIKWSWLPVLLIGSLVGGYCGAALAANKGNALIKKVFEAITLLVGISLIAQAII